MKYAEKHDALAKAVGSLDGLIKAKNVEGIIAVIDTIPRYGDPLNLIQLSKEAAKVYSAARSMISIGDPALTKHIIETFPFEALVPVLNAVIATKDAELIDLAITNLLSTPTYSKDQLESALFGNSDAMRNLLGLNNTKLTTSVIKKLYDKGFLDGVNLVRYFNGYPTITMNIAQHVIESNNIALTNIVMGELKKERDGRVNGSIGGPDGAKHYLVELTDKYEKILAERKAHKEPSEYELLQNKIDGFAKTIVTGADAKKQILEMLARGNLALTAYFIDKMSGLDIIRDKDVVSQLFKNPHIKTMFLEKLIKAQPTVFVDSSTLMEALTEGQRKEVLSNSDVQYYIKRSTSDAAKSLLHSYKTGQSVDRIRAKQEFLRLLDKMDPKDLEAFAEHKEFAFILAADKLYAENKLVGDVVKVAWTYNQDGATPKYVEFADKVRNLVGNVGADELKSASQKIFQSINKIQKVDMEQTIGDKLSKFMEPLTKLVEGLINAIKGIKAGPEPTAMEKVADKVSRGVTSQGLGEKVKELTKHAKLNKAEQAKISKDVGGPILS